MVYKSNCPTVEPLKLLRWRRQAHEFVMVLAEVKVRIHGGTAAAAAAAICAAAAACTAAACTAAATGACTLQTPSSCCALQILAHNVMFDVKEMCVRREKCITCTCALIVMRFCGRQASLGQPWNACDMTTCQ